MAALYTEYEAICQKSALDPAEHIDNIVNIIEKTQWAKNSAWFVDGFSDFPHQQMRLIQLLIQQADHIHFAFDISGVGDEQSGRVNANHTACQSSILPKPRVWIMTSSTRAIIARITLH